MRALVLILAAAILAFGGALWAPFHLDDFALLQDPVITSPDGWWRSFQPIQTRPLTWFTFWLNYRLGGADPAGYHLINLLLHLGSIALLWRVLPPLAVAIFALHPIQTEAVVYVFDRATLLMTFFCLLSYREWKHGRPWRAVLWFLPALLGKEECVTFPLMLLLFDRKQWRPVAVMLAMSLAAGLRVLYVSSVTAGSGAGLQSGITPLDYFLTQGLALLRYLRLLVLPYGFSIESPLIPTSLGIVAWAAVLALVALAWRYVDPKWPLAWLLLIAPSSSLLPAADLSADRRMYLPMLAIGALVSRVRRGAGPQACRAETHLGTLLCLALALISLRQTLIWQRGERLWTEAIQFAPHKLRPRIQLARNLPSSDALRVLNDAEKLAPEDPAVPSERGRILLEQNNPQAALSAFGRALALAPSDARAVNNRGVALLRLNQREAAIGDFRRALEMEPCLFDARRNLYAAGVQPLPAPAHCRYTPEQKDSLPR